MTRYPEGGKGKKWTVKELAAINSDWNKDTLNDSDGLFGEVRVSTNKVVSITFKYGFKWQGKKVWHYCGTYPSTNLAAIREIRDEARKQISEGLDPRSKKVADRIEKQSAIEAIIAKDELSRNENKTIQDLYDVWIQDGVSRLDENKAIKLSFNKHALPTLGKIPLKSLTENDLLKVYRQIIGQGKQRTAVAIANDIGQMLRWAEIRQPWRRLMIEGNPSRLVNIENELSIDYSEERERVLSVEEIQKLRNVFTNSEEIYSKAKNKYEAIRPVIKETQIALWVCLSTTCRIGELLMAEWKHINLEIGTWFIPKENVKGKRGKKQEHLIYLSNFTQKQFKQLHEITGKSKWVFPATNNDCHVCLKSVSKQVGDRQTKFKKRTKLLQNRVNNNSLVIGEEAWTPHDLRRTATTIMQELEVPLDVIDRCQNHILQGSKVRRHYLHYQYENEKKIAWEKLGAKLENILAN